MESSLNNIIAIIPSTLRLPALEVGAQGDYLVNNCNILVRLRLRRELSRTHVPVCLPAAKSEFGVGSKLKSGFAK